VSVGVEARNYDGTVSLHVGKKQRWIPAIFFGGILSPLPGDLARDYGNCD
jgi:hypothetical protein